MDRKLFKVSPLVAFTLTTIAVTVYMILQNRWIFPLNPSVGLGRFLSIGIPILLSALIYAGIAVEAQASKWTMWLRIAAAAILAPSIAWALYLSLGFVLLGWQM